MIETLKPHAPDLAPVSENSGVPYTLAKEFRTRAAVPAATPASVVQPVVTQTPSPITEQSQDNNPSHSQ